MCTLISVSQNIASSTWLACSALNDIFHWYVLSFILNKSLISAEAEASPPVIIENKEASSAKSLTLDISPCSK